MQTSDCVIASDAACGSIIASYANDLTVLRSKYRIFEFQAAFPDGFERQVYGRFPGTLNEPCMSNLKPLRFCRENMTGFLLQIKRF